MKDPKCKLCGKSPIVKTSKHLFIDLPKLTETLSEYIEKAGAESRWSTNALNIARSWAKDLHKRCITRDLKWGTPVPLEGFKDKVFYVWFDAPIGYISITAAYTDKWRSWWKNDKEVDLVQFLGKDNIPFHTVIFPCTLLGCKSGWTTMKHISTTGMSPFLTSIASNGSNKLLYKTNNSMNSKIMKCPFLLFSFISSLLVLLFFLLFLISPVLGLLFPPSFYQFILFFFLSFLFFFLLIFFFF